ncbi:MAG: DUF1844 domain-containing protein [Myxococcota bacterium]
MAGEQGGPRGFQMQDAGDAPLAEMSFATLVLSLTSSALVHLGAAPEPGTTTPGAPDLPLARHTIDILEILKAKTQGNLDADESALLEQVLHDLHMRFLAAKRG